MRKKIYYELTITTDKPNQDIWVSDDKGFLVCKCMGKVAEGLVAGKYYFQFGLKGAKIPVILNRKFPFFRGHFILENPNDKDSKVIQ